MGICQREQLSLWICSFFSSLNTKTHLKAAGFVVLLGAQSFCHRHVSHGSNHPVQPSKELLCFWVLARQSGVYPSPRNVWSWCPVLEFH